MSWKVPAFWTLVTPTSPICSPATAVGLDWVWAVRLAFAPPPDRRSRGPPPGEFRRSGVGHIDVTDLTPKMMVPLLCD